MKGLLQGSIPSFPTKQQLAEEDDTEETAPRAPKSENNGLVSEVA